MTRRILIRPAALADIEGAREWYNSQLGGLGDEFALEVAGVIERLRENAESFPVLVGTIRRTLLQRFPYGVFYVGTAEAVVVYAILHMRRNPRRWRVRDG